MVCHNFFSLKKVVATLAAVVELRRAKLHIFENLSTTGIIVKYLSSSGKSMMKSMLTVCHGASEHGRG